MKSLRYFYREHFTKFLGYWAAAIPALLAIEDLIPKEKQKYWLAAAVLIGLLVVRRGHENGKRTKYDSDVGKSP